MSALHETRVVWPIFVSSRLGVLLIGFLGILLLGYAPSGVPWRVYDNDLLNMPARWDTGWYIGIAERGYSWDATHAQDMQNIAFFPAYPLLIRAGAGLVGGAPLWVAVGVSLASFLGALVYLFRLGRETLDPDAAMSAIALLAAYPFALYFSTAYSEALFLLTVAATCFHFERRDAVLAALWGLAAGLCRPPGCLLSVVLALIVLRDRHHSSPPALVKRLATAAMPGIGMLIYSAYIYMLTGNPLQWIDAHGAYGRVYRGVGAFVTDRIRHVQVNGIYDYFAVQTIDMVNTAAVILVLGLVWPVYRRFGAPYAAMLTVNVIPPVLMGGALSMGRVTSVLFPIFFWLGATIPARHRVGWLLAFAMLQAVFAVAFFTWRPFF